MNVDDDLVHAELAQARDCDLQKWNSAQFYQRLGPVVRQRPQARSKPGGQDHGLHLPKVSSSRWCTTTSMPGRSRKRRASCSAEYAERCCPPVHPNETIRFLKP